LHRGTNIIKPLETKKNWGLFFGEIFFLSIYKKIGGKIWKYQLLPFFFIIYFLPQESLIFGAVSG
jgi:hypothetical protein